MLMTQTPAAAADKRVLIIEDDVSLSELVAGLLRECGYRVKQCFDGSSGLKTAQSESFSLVLLDVLLPKMDGFSVLRKLRNNSDTPVLMLTAKGAEEDRITGFKTGADDYLPKPFSMDELVLRIEAIIRRSQAIKSKHNASNDQTITLDGLSLNLKNALVSYQQQALELTNMELRLLALLMQHESEVLSKPYLYQELMARPYSRNERSLDVHISKLRRKLKAAGFDSERIQTMHGQGYCLR